MIPEKLETAEEVAVRLGVEETTVRAWARKGEIPVAVRKGKVLRFNWPDVFRKLKADAEPNPGERKAAEMALAAVHAACAGRSKRQETRNKTGNP